MNLVNLRTRKLAKRLSIGSVHIHSMTAVSARRRYSDGFHGHRLRLRAFFDIARYRLPPYGVTGQPEFIIGLCQELIKLTLSKFPF